jgi:hypothetical protein
MVKQIIVQSFCDLCAVQEQETPATTEATHNGRVLDLCDEHDTVISDLRRQIDRLFAEGVALEPVRPVRRGGRPTDDQKESVEWRTCPECGHIPPTRSALGAHVKTAHNKRLRDYTWST